MAYDRLSVGRALAEFHAVMVEKAEYNQTVFQSIKPTP
jgi:hypothetical protein